jgi:hypothetical protein
MFSQILKLIPRIEFRLFVKRTDAQVFFVTRMKDNAQFEVFEQREPPQNRGILKDQTIRAHRCGSTGEVFASGAPDRIYQTPEEAP